MTALVALALLAAAASAGLSAPWWLALLSLGWLISRPGDFRSRRRAAFPADRPAEVVIATIYVRAGKLVLRRRRAA